MAPEPRQAATLGKQFRLLMRKNLAVIRTNWLSTLIQLFISVIVVFLLFVFLVDDRYNRDGFNRWTFKRTGHEDWRVGGLATCDDIASPLCTTSLAIVHDPQNAAAASRVEDVLARLLANNPHVPNGSVRRYTTKGELNEAMLKAPLTVLQALHFPDNFGFRPPAEAKFTVQVNQSQFCVFGAKSCTAPWNTVELPLQVRRHGRCPRRRHRTAAITRRLAWCHHAPPRAARMAGGAECARRLVFRGGSPPLALLASQRRPPLARR